MLNHTLHVSPFPPPPPPNYPAPHCEQQQQARAAAHRLAACALSPASATTSPSCCSTTTPSCSSCSSAAVECDTVAAQGGRACSSITAQTAVPPPPALCSMPADSHAQTSAVEAFCLALQSKTSNDWQQVCPLTCFRLGSRTSNVMPPALHALVLQPTTRRCFAVHGCPFSRIENSAAGCCHLRLHV